MKPAPSRRRLNASGSTTAPGKATAQPTGNAFAIQCRAAARTISFHASPPARIPYVPRMAMQPPGFSQSPGLQPVKCLLDDRRLLQTMESFAYGDEVNRL